MIDKVSGKVAYAVMSIGGFLGIGDRYHPLPWEVLTYDTSQDGYVVDLDRSILEGAPTYGTSETPNWSDRRWGQQVHDYYGARPTGTRRSVRKETGPGGLPPSLLYLGRLMAPGRRP